MRPHSRQILTVEETFGQNGWHCELIEGRDVLRAGFDAHHTRVDLTAQAHPQLNALSVVTESEFRAQCSTYGRPDLADDPRFTDGRLRATNRSELNAELKASAALTTTAEFAQRAAEFDLPAAVVQTLHDLPDEPQIVNNDIFVEREHPVAGRVREPRPAARFGATPQRVSDHAPSFGQHSAEIVAELGLDPDELLAAGVIF